MKLFLFPHQDDESPVFHEIDQLTKNAEPLTIIFLTTGQASTEVCERRNRESLAVLDRLGVKKSQVHFLGSKVGAPDGQLHRHLEKLHLAITALMKDELIDGIYVPAWEGGHQDHDAAHMLGVALASQWKCLESSRQFPYYHGQGLKSIFFKTLSPLPGNGQPKTAYIAPRKRLQYLSMLLLYKSQVKALVGLGPFIVLHYLFYGTQVLQGLSVARMGEKPHQGPMLYERRAFCSFDVFQQETAEFRLKRLF